MNVEREIVVNIFWKLLKERSESSGIYEYTNIMCKGIKLNTYSFLATAALLIKKRTVFVSSSPCRAKSVQLAELKQVYQGKKSVGFTNYTKIFLHKICELFCNHSEYFGITIKRAMVKRKEAQKSMQ